VFSAQLVNNRLVPIVRLVPILRHDTVLSSDF
jgi:hypothetical protein